jgi:hypothetical protein
MMTPATIQDEVEYNENNEIGMNPDRYNHLLLFLLSHIANDLSDIEDHMREIRNQRL